MKTHKKAGITCSLKNIVGVNTYKNFLPHCTEGTPSEGGDQFPDSSLKNSFEFCLLRYFKRIAYKSDGLAKYLTGIKRLGKVIFGETKNVIRSGNWYGNDTLWRMILDLNKLLLYGKPDGTLDIDGLKQKKKYLTIVDAVIAGQGNGPEAPDSKSSGIILAGRSPVAVDCLAAKIMGFDYTKIPLLKNSFKIKQLPIADYDYNNIIIKSNTIKEYRYPLNYIHSDICSPFKPAAGWQGHIETQFRHNKI